MALQSKPIPSPALARPAAAAAYLSISRRTVDRLMAGGELPRVVISRRCVGVPYAALDDYIAARNAAAAA